MLKSLCAGLLLVISAQASLLSGQHLPSAPPAAGAGGAAALKVGQSAPDFTLEDVQGHKVSLADARGQTPTLIYFFRGWW